MLRSTFALAFLLLMMVAATASAGTSTVTVTGTLVHVYSPAEKSPPCLVASFYRWNAKAGTVRAKATYQFNGGDVGIGEKPAPFDDRFNSFGFDAFSPVGQSQLYAGYASHQGTAPRDCSQDLELQKSRALYSQTATVTLTIDRAKTPACTTAKKKLSAQKKVVTRLRASYKKAKTTAGKRTLRRKLRAATTKETALRKSVSKTC